MNAQSLQWAYLPNWNGWWLTRDAGLTVERVYGPFRGAAEVQLAADLHGVPPPDH